MMRMFKRPINKTTEAGNAIITILVAVGVAGALGAATVTLINGPMKTMSEVNQKAIAESQLQAAAKILIVDAANRDAADEDCESDQFIEPRPFKTAGIGDTAPTGGGVLPDEIGAAKFDAWGTTYGYCVWDHGPSNTQTGGCSGLNYLDGTNSQIYTTIAVISAGPDKTFQTTCYDFSTADDNADGDLADDGDTLLVVTTDGSDDMTLSYSYTEAATETAALWTVRADSTTGELEASTSKDVDIQGGAGFTDDVDLSGNAGLNLPTQNEATDAECTAGSREGQLRRNTESDPQVIEVCESNTWSEIGTGTGTAEATSTSVNGGRGYGWGLQTNGLLGNGQTSSSAESPTQIHNIDNFVKIEAWDTHACGLTENGYIYCWGDDTDGQLGNGDDETADQSTPYLITAYVDFVDVAVGEDHTCGLLESGTAYCWGADDVGQLGNGSGTTGDQTSPTAVTTITDFTKISAGSDHTCGLRSNGEIHCWGDDGQEELGDGAGQTDQEDPVQVSTYTDFVDLSVGQNYSCAVRSNGEAHCWGSNAYARLGQGSTGGRVEDPTIVSTYSDFVEISAKYRHTCGLREGGIAVCWGEGEKGRLGNDDFVLVETPVLVVTDERFIQVAVGDELTCAISVTGKAYCWGNDLSGELGNGSSVTDNQRTPYAVESNHTFAFIEAGYEAGFAIVGKPNQTLVQTNIVTSADMDATIDNAAITTGLITEEVGDQAGIGFRVDRSPAATDTVSASITAVREGTNGYGGMAFKTLDSDGNLNTAAYLDDDGDFGLEVPAGTEVDSLLQIGNHGYSSWNDEGSYGKGVLITRNASGTDNPAYFGFKGSDGADAALLYTDALNFNYTSDGTGSSVIPIASFDSNLASVFYGTILPPTGDDVDIDNSSYSNTAANGGGMAFTRYGGSVSSPGAASSGDVIGGLYFKGYDGSALTSDAQAAIYGVVSGSVSSGDVPVDIVFGMSSAGSASDSEVMRLTTNGKLGIGTASPYEKLSVAGGMQTLNGLRIGNDTTCSSASDEGTLRYDGTIIDYCDGDSWETPVSMPDCSPIPFDLKDIEDATAGAFYSTETFIVGGLNPNATCHLIVVANGTTSRVVNGTPETGVIEVSNGDYVSITVRASGTGSETVTTYVGIGDKVDRIDVTTAP